MKHPSKICYRRSLPHWHPPGRSIFLTWRLHGSLPQSVINYLKIIREEAKRKGEKRPGWTADSSVIEFKKLFARVDSILDKAREGPLWLANVDVANMVQHVLLEHYAPLDILWSYVVMANHRHVLLKPKNSDVSMSQITQRIKGYTSREANLLLGQTGQRFWQDESFDHWPRDKAEFSRIVKYIENNPVKAGLVDKPEHWIWSSAAERKRRGWNDFRALT